MAHQTTVWVEPTTHTDVAFGAVTGGSTTSLPFKLAAGAAATRLIKKSTVQNELIKVAILNIVYDNEFAVLDVVDRRQVVERVEEPNW